MRRVTLSLDDALADEFDAWVLDRGYATRSEAFRDLLRGRLEKEPAAPDDDGHCVATVSYVYDHHERQLAARLAESQHAHHGLTLSTLHVHLDHRHCLEVVALRGRGEEVRRFANQLIAERGVRHGSLNLVPVRAQISAVRQQPHVHLTPLR